MSGAESWAELSPDPEPVPLALIVRSQPLVIRRITRRLVLSSLVLVALVVIGIGADQAADEPRNDLIWVSAVSMLLGFAWSYWTAVRQSQSPMVHLTASRRAAAQRAGKRYRPHSDRNVRIVAFLVLVAVWFVFPFLALIPLGFFLGLLLAELCRYATFRRRFGDECFYYPVFTYYARHQEDPIFAEPLTPADYAAAPPEPWDRPPLRHPVEAEWPTLPVQPPAGTLVDRVSSLRPAFMTGTIAPFLLIGFAARPGVPSRVGAALLVLAFTTLGVVLGSYLYLRAKRNRQNLLEVRLGYSTAGNATVSQDYEERHARD